MKNLNKRTQITSLLPAFVLVVGATLQTAKAQNDAVSGLWLVGTWYLALDTTAFGLPPGLPLSGLAIFHADGTFQIQDGGDFGQFTFLNTQNSQQFGAWRMGPGGTVVATSLFQEADLATGEVLRWQKVENVIRRTDDRNVVESTITVSTLECQNLLPIPTALTCPDPIDNADQFLVIPPAGVLTTLKRLVPVAN